MSWTVVCTVKSDRFFVTHFIRHYLRLGASEIILYFDDPANAAFSRVAARGKVKVFLCDANHWKRIGIARPTAVEGRQFLNFMDATSKTASNWALHVDIDELLHSRRNVGSLLDDLPANTFSLLVRPLEAVWERSPNKVEVFATPWFKRRLHRKRLSLMQDLFGQELGALTRHGLWGHQVGKSFVNLRHKILVPGLHKSTPVDSSLQCDVETDHLDLLHFEAMRYQDWKNRAIDRVTGRIEAAKMSSIRANQMALIQSTFDTGGDTELNKLYNVMNVFSGKRLTKARRLGFVVERNLTTPPQKIWTWMP